MAHGAARASAPALWVFGLGLLAQLPLWAGWLAEPGARLIDNPFTGGHVWAAEAVARALAEGRWPDPTTDAGFPLARQARFLAWAVLLPAALLRPLISPLLTVQAAHLLGPALGGASLVLLARRLESRAGTFPLIAGGLLFTLSPVTLGAALSGQVENTQTWILPFGLLLALEVSTGPAPGRRVLLPLWALFVAFAGLTSPYLAMLLAFCAPWALGRARAEGAGWASALLPWALAGLVLALVQAWLQPGSFEPDRVLYRPSHGAEGWPPIWVQPLPVASVDALLTGLVRTQVKAMVLHQPYLGLALLLGALLLGGQRRRLLPLVLLGVVLAMGPRLGFQDGPVLIFGREIPLPGALARGLHLPIARGGQYYRAIVLAHLGLALMLALAPARRGRSGWMAALLLLGLPDALRAVAAPGLPWPVAALPTATWRAWAEDPAPGAVLHLPMESTRLRPNHPLRLAGMAIHHRPVSDMPRAFTEASADPLLGRVWRSTHVRPTEPVPARDALAAAGFRYLVVDLPAVPERRSLMARLERAWGPPQGEAEGLSWWIAGP